MDSNRLIKRFVYLLGLCAIIASLGLFARPTGVMALSAGQITITAITPIAPKDHNGNCAEGPQAMYLQVQVMNTSGGTLTNVSVNFTALTGTPSSLQLGGGESPTRFIGTMADNEIVNIYYFVDYMQLCVNGVGTPPNDGDLLPYRISVSDSNAGTVSSNFNLEVDQQQSANAGGLINTATFGAGAVVGQIIPYTVSYDFGNIDDGGYILIQPAGNKTFNAACFRLVATDITNATNMNVSPNPITATSDNQLHFTNVQDQTNNGNSAATVVYYFEVLCNNQTTTAKPFADMTSGTPQKYSGNYDKPCTTTPCNFSPSSPATNPTFLVDKRVSPTTAPTLPANVTYTVLITNTSAFQSRIDKITDTLPAPLTFQGATVLSEVTTSNSTIFPSIGANGTMNFVGQPTTKITNGTLNGSYLVPAGGSIKLVYTVTIPAGTPDGYYTNYAAGILGTNTVGQDSAVIKVGNAPTAVTMASFAAYATNDAIRVQWRTSAESKVAGFNLYRATSQNRATATQLNAQLIAAHGASLPYSFNDTTAEAGTEYWYWIEIVNDGEPNQEMGPTSAQIAQQFTIFMPFLSR